MTTRIEFRCQRKDNGKLIARWSAKTKDEVRARLAEYLRRGEMRPRGWKWTRDQLAAYEIVVVTIAESIDCVLPIEHFLPPQPPLPKAPASNPAIVPDRFALLDTDD